MVKVAIIGLMHDTDLISESMETLVVDNVEKINSIIEETGRRCDQEYLVGGRLGLALYFLHYSKVFEDRGAFDKVIGIVNDIFKNLTEQKNVFPNFSFDKGLSGFGHLLSLLKRDGLYDYDKEALSPWESKMFALAKNWANDADERHFSELFDVILYFSGDKNNQKFRKYLFALICQVHDKKVVNKIGDHINSQFHEYNHQNKVSSYPSSCLINILQVLLKVYQSGISDKRVKQMINQGLDYFLTDSSKTKYLSKGYIKKDTDTILKCCVLARDNLDWGVVADNGILLLYEAGLVTKQEHLLHIADNLIINHIECFGVGHVAQKPHPTIFHITRMADFYGKLLTITGNNGLFPDYEYWIYKTLQYLPTSLEGKVFQDKELSWPRGLIGVSLTLLHYLSSIKSSSGFKRKDTGSRLFSF